MVNQEIRKEFFDLLNSKFNTKVAKAFKNSLLQNSFYKYASDNTERKNYLVRQKEYDKVPFWNPFTIKGVFYADGQCKIIEREIDDLIIEYDINLSNLDFGKFQNELDKEKPFGLISYRRLIMAVNDCMETQIINEMIRDLEINEENQNIDIKPFRTPEHFNQFKIYMERYINFNDINVVYTEISFLFQMLLKRNFIEKTKHMEFAKWLLENEFINDDVFRAIDEPNGFKAFGKCKGGGRILKFEKVFELD